MQEPVTALDGYIYERDAIEDWFNNCATKCEKTTSPKTGSNIGRLLVPAHVLKAMISDYLAGIHTTAHPRETVRIERWLASLSPHLAQYADAFHEYGYNDTGFLAGATEQDILDAIDECGVKKGHRRALLTAAAALRAGGA